MKTTLHYIKCPPEGLNVEAAMLRVPMTDEERADWNSAKGNVFTVKYPGEVHVAQRWNRSIFGVETILRHWVLIFQAPEVEEYEREGKVDLQLANWHPT